jgi:hypothetical protein
VIDRSKKVPAFFYESPGGRQPKTQKTPAKDMELALKRMKEVE